MRNKIRDSIVSHIGKGASTSSWFDNWHLTGPLCRHITPCNIHSANLSLNARVRDIICDGIWICPQMRDGSNPTLSLILLLPSPLPTPLISSFGEEGMALSLLSQSVMSGSLSVLMSQIRIGITWSSSLRIFLDTLSFFGLR